MQTPGDHPKQQLLFFVADDIGATTARAVENLVAQLGTERTWSLGHPRFVDEVDGSSVLAPEDLPVRTLGGVLELYCTWPPFGPQLQKDLDQANFEDVNALVQSLIGFSSTTGHDIEFELDGEHVGAIREGKADRILRDGFLGEWERSLQGSPPV